jgi:dynein light chain LC8-type
MSGGAVDEAAAVVVLSSQMDATMQEAVIGIAKLAVKDFVAGEVPFLKDVAKAIKLKVTETYSGSWHCIAGTNFGGFMSFQTGHFLHIMIGEYAVMVFKHG